MKTYEIELRRVSYITMTVEADDTDKAEEAVWREVEHGRADINDAEWDITSIEEVEK